jgi:hypothetical protein
LIRISCAAWGNNRVKKIEDYRQHAQECRALAKTASIENRAMLEHMAATWDQLADARAEHIARRERLASSESQSDSD